MDLAGLRFPVRTLQSLEALQTLNYKLLKNPEKMKNILPYSRYYRDYVFSFGVLKQIVVHFP